MQGLRCCLLSCITFSVVFAASGRLSKQENERLKASCGNYHQYDNEFEGLFFHDKSTPTKQKYMTAISARHIIVDAKSEFLNFTYSREKCDNNVILFATSLDDLPGVHVHAVTKAYYIGSCDENLPRGFVVLEYHPEFPKLFSPVCLSNQPLEAETTVQVFTTRNVTPQSVEYIFTKVQNGKHSDQLVTEDTVDDFGGPVFDPKFVKKTYVGHAYGHEETILIVPIYEYIDQICAATGICVGEENETIGASDDNSAKLLSFEDVEEVDQPKIEVSFGSSDGFKINSEEKDELIVLSDVEFDIDYENDNGSGENFITFDSEEVEEQELPKMTYLSVMPEEKFEPSEISDDVLESGTVVRAEPYSAIFIPLPGKEVEGYQPSGFPSSTEFLIAFLIMLSLFFYVCMCLYGCVDYKGKSVFWKPDLGQLPF